MWLLDWLSSKWNELNDWFSYSYWNVRNFINSIPGYINALYSSINASYNNAVSQITASIQNFYNRYIAPAVNYLQQQINEHGGIIGYLQSIVNNFIASVNNTITNVFNNVVAWAMGKYDAWIASIAANLNAFIATHLPEILAFLDFKRKYDAWLSDVMTKITGFDLSQLMQHYNNTKGAVTMFASNPLGFILDLLWTQGITFICYLLGYGLGSTIYQLPAKPNWSNSTGGSAGTYIPTDKPFTNPVAKPYVSGYTFATGHYGVDLGIAMGETIYAAHEGDVLAAGWSTVGYGNYIDISGSVYWSRYAHLQSFLVSPGMHVMPGQPIALGDSTGNSTGAHLHFELKVNGTYVDPIGYLH